MDNQVFRETYDAINERYCPFEKSILTNQCACSRAQRFCIAEREGVHCQADEAQARCIGLLQLLRNQARFALKTTDGSAALAHAKAMRVQVGGLRGLHRALHPESGLHRALHPEPRRPTRSRTSTPSSRRPSCVSVASRPCPFS